MQFASEVLVSAFIVVGGFFLFVGSFGLAKLTDTMRRLHAPTKATTLGIGALLIASMLYFLLFHQLPTAHELLITLFLFLTAPVTANMVAKAHIFRHNEVQKELTQAASGPGWATLSEVDEPGKSS
ncbi:Na+/H+ antiporter subunit G [Pseudorhodoplanes sp.]|uniref:Na+/H+ antiporter subunit G n=1 Tax=Pseudorhodoplanes sp. TaxID=1934341 RepID=UPI003919551F